jgi:hypothetical protein
MEENEGKTSYLKTAHKSARRSLWSALPRRRFGSPFRYVGND